MLEFILRVVVISSSGALAPGPLTAATASTGLKHGWKAGLKTSIGHTIVELPLVILLSLGIAAFFKNPIINYILGIVGSGFLFFFGFSTIREAFQKQTSRNDDIMKTPSPLLTGVVLTGLNPYFIAWWVGIGAPLISEAMHIAGIIGIGIFYIAHVWLDYGWLSLIAGVSSLGRFKKTLFRWLLVLLGSMVIYFGVHMLIRTLNTAG